MEVVYSMISLVVGLALGAGFVWLAVRARMASAVSNAQSEVARLNEELRKETGARAAAEEKNSRLTPLEDEITKRDAMGRNQADRIDELQNELSTLRVERAQLKANLDQERERANERILELNRQRKELSTEFENLANKILDEKSKKFTEQNKTNLDALLRPLGDKIKDFEKKVDDTYVKESKDRYSLVNEITKLREQNAQIGKDAVSLTNALRGETKTQGIWGEHILETILQKAGFVKGRHYEVQVSINTDDGRRVQPDVILHLPDNRHIVVDSKVNLTAYTRYCEMGDCPERDDELQKHVAAFRKHVADLSSKKYQDRYKLPSLEFVLMFVPLEPAFMLALQTDISIYDFAFQERISIVTPSTLHATVHTLMNIWHQDMQNKYAMKIAEEAGKLYNKFADFTKDLEEIGTKLVATQKTYDSAHNKLTSGTGNLVTRAEKLLALGVKAKKKLSAKLLESAQEEEQIEDTEVEVEVGAEEVAH
jgi:DNA recombination protein RmuC